MDAEISKTTKKILEKQGMKFKLSTKVLEGDASGEGVKLKVEAAKGGKQETVSTHSHYSDLYQVSELTVLSARRRCCPRSHRSPPLHRRSWSRKHWSRSRQQGSPNNRRTIPDQTSPHPRNRRLHLRTHARAQSRRRSCRLHRIHN